MGRLLEIARAALAETEQANPLGPDKDVSTADHRTKQPYADAEHRPVGTAAGAGNVMAVLAALCDARVLEGRPVCTMQGKRA